MRTAAQIFFSIAIAFFHRSIMYFDLGVSNLTLSVQEVLVVAGSLLVQFGDVRSFFIHLYLRYAHQNYLYISVCSFKTFIFYALLNGPL